MYVLGGKEKLFSMDSLKTVVKLRIHELAKKEKSI